MSVKPSITLDQLIEILPPYTQLSCNTSTKAWPTQSAGEMRKLPWVVEATLKKVVAINPYHLEVELNEVETNVTEILDFPPVTAVSTLCIQESESFLDNGITLEVWFTRSGESVVRTDLYKAYDGSVVAFQDCVNGTMKPLYLEQNFKELEGDEGSLNTILRSAGVSSFDKVLLFNAGR